MANGGDSRWPFGFALNASTGTPRCDQQIARPNSAAHVSPRCSEPARFSAPRGPKCPHLQLMGHGIPRKSYAVLGPVLGPKTRSARNYIARVWRVIAWCVNKLRISIKGAEVLSFSWKYPRKTAFFPGGTVYHPIRSYPRVLPRMLSSGT
jgi:hypothetical protein